MLEFGERFLRLAFGRFDTTSATKGELVGTKQSMYEYIIVRLDEDIRFLVDAGLLAIAKADAIRTLFDQYKAPINAGGVSTLVHHDLADHNIMFDGKRIITGFFLIGRRQWRGIQY